MRLERTGVPKIYAIADAGVLSGRGLAEGALRIAEAGVSWIQVRGKELAESRLCEEVLRIADHRVNRPFVLWVNDRPDVALLYGAEGVHLGQDDLPPSAARRVVGADCWIGRSTHDLQQVGKADADPDVDLIALGPIFETRNKVDPDPVVGLEALGEARRITDKPLVAIGGLGERNLHLALQAGADSVALLGAVCRGDVAANCARLLAAAADCCPQQRVARAKLVFLTGFMGAGKSRVGRLLSELLDFSFTDLDSRIEERAGRTIVEIFSGVGEEGFRALESEALVEVAEIEGVVVATGGGVVGSVNNRQAMRAAGTIVWLDPDIDTILSRLSEESIARRPLLRSEEEARRLWLARLAHYEDCDLRIRIGAEEEAHAVAGRVAEQLSMA